MPTVTKEYGFYRVRIRCRGLPNVSKTFKSKTDARRRGEKTERAMQLGLLSPDQDCALKELLLRYGKDITPAKRGASQELSRIHKLCQPRIVALRLADLQSSHIQRIHEEHLIVVITKQHDQDWSLLSLVTVARGNELQAQTRGASMVKALFTEFSLLMSF